MGFRRLVSGEVDPRRRKHCVPAGDPRVGYLRIVDAGGEAYGTEADMGRFLDMLTRCPARVVYGRAAGEHGVEIGCGPTWSCWRRGPWPRPSAPCRPAGGS